MSNPSLPPASTTTIGLTPSFSGASRTGQDRLRYAVQSWTIRRLLCRLVMEWARAAWAHRSFSGLPRAKPNSRTIVAAPTQGQLRGVIWAEMARGYGSALRNGFPLGGKFKSLDYTLDDGWTVEGFGSGSVESKSGRHAGDLLAVIDEASGVPASVLEAIDSLNPSRRLYLGNPLRPEGKFYEVCEQSASNPGVNVVRIPSLESPHIELERSPWGMADRTWLETSRFEYGEESQWWLSHVLAQFPGSTTDTLLPVAWLNLCGQTIHVPRGETWLGVDIGEGNGGDESIIVGRDDNGVPRDASSHAFESSNTWVWSILPSRVRAMSDRFQVRPEHIVYDQNGIGADFDGRLRAVGIEGALRASRAVAGAGTSSPTSEARPAGRCDEGSTPSGQSSAPPLRARVLASGSRKLRSQSPTSSSSGTSPS